MWRANSLIGRISRAKGDRAHGFRPQLIDRHAHARLLFNINRTVRMILKRHRAEADLQVWPVFRRTALDEGRHLRRAERKIAAMGHEIFETFPIFPEPGKI